MHQQASFSAKKKSSKGRRLAPLSPRALKMTDIYVHARTHAHIISAGSLSEWMEREVVGDVRAVSYLDRCRGFNCGCQPKQAADNTGRLPIGQGWNDIVGAGEQ